MLVGELKKALEGVSDNLQVVINLPDTMCYTTGGQFVMESAIGPNEFWIEAGEEFDY